MKHCSKEEFKRRILAFNKMLLEEAETAQKELEESMDSFYKFGLVVGKVQTLQKIQQILKQEFEV